MVYLLNELADALNWQKWREIIMWDKTKDKVSSVALLLSAGQSLKTILGKVMG